MSVGSALVVAAARCMLVALAGGASVLAAESAPSRLRYTAPQNWTRHVHPQTQSVSLQAPGGNAGITLLPSTPFAGTAEQWRDEAWRRLVEKTRVLGTPRSGAQGEFLTRFAVFSQPDGSRPWMGLYTRVSDGHGEAALFVASNEREFSAHLATANDMIHRTNIAANPASSPTADGASAPVPAAPAVSGRSTSFTLDDYVFLAPDGWQTQRRPDHILLTQNPAGEGCIIQLLPPQPSSGDLERDARAVFATMYPGWQYRRSGPQQYTLAKGILPQGLNFHLIEASMSATTTDGRYHIEDGTALVIQAGDRIAIVAARHRDLLAHVDCHRQYRKWARFFNSLHLRNAPAAREAGPPAAERIVGRWRMAESGASAEYLFAANGNFAFVGALGSTSTSSDARYEYLHIKTYAFPGDGSYSISGRQLALAKRGAREPERAVFRFDQVNHGGTAWNDRLYLLTAGPSGENEVCYERAPK